MIWIRQIGIVEYLLIGGFIVFYFLYILRIALIARKMKSGMRSVFYKFFLRSFYFFLLIIALLGPSFGNVKNEIKSISREIFFVVDLSLSMNCQDIQPNRIDKAKHEIKKMIASFSSDKIGLIGFTNSATIICPLTNDQSALELFTQSLNPDMMSTQGSDISKGLDLAVNEFKKSDPINNRNKLIILITDGEDFGNKAQMIAKTIQQNQIHFMTLAIGTTHGGTIPFNGEVKKDKKSKPIITTLNSATLQEISDLADGTYFEITNQTNETELLINKANSIEGTVSDTLEVDASSNKYLYFLVIAFFFIIIDVLITVRTVKI